MSMDHRILDQVPRAMLLKRFPVPRNFGMAPESRIAQDRDGQPRPANLHLIEVGDGRDVGAGMMIIEKMLPRALGRKLAVVSIERLGAELELEKIIAV
jgi:hypothetical protein